MMRDERDKSIERLEAARSEMRRAGVDLLLVAPSADLRYLTGYSGHSSERAKFLALTRDGASIILVPALEAPGVPRLDGVRVVPYDESDDAYRVLRTALGDESEPRQAAITDQAWAVTLLALQATFARASFRSAGPLLRPLRIIKGAAEIDLLARAGAMADRAFGHMVERPFAGRTEREVAEELAGLLREEGLESSGWGPIVGSGPNSASPHHSAGDRTIERGDSVVLDFGGPLEGYQADMTRTVHVGEPDAEFRHVYDLVRSAQEAGVLSVRPGQTAEAIDAATREVISAGGYGAYFIHRTGHGLGLDEHEEPYIIAGNTLAVEPGMVFSIEPGVYLPGRFGVRIEDIVVVKAEGAQRLNNANHDLVIVQ